MKVVQLIKSDSGFGPAIHAYRRHEALLRMGVDSAMFVAESRRAGALGVSVFKPPMDPVSRLRRRLRHLIITRSYARYRVSRPSGYEGFSDDRTVYGRDLLLQLPACDVMDVSAMFDFVDYQEFFLTVPRRTPVVRTLGDMTFFTGGCHHDFGCGKFQERCGACPQLGSGRVRDLSRQVWERKHTALSAVEPRRLHVVALSPWLAEEARRSSLLRNFPITVIPHGVDIQVFRPRDRGFARETLGISRDADVVLFVAEPIGRLVKGFSHLVEALHGLSHLPRLLLVTAGSGTPPVRIAIPHIHLGYVGNERLLSLVYSAADVVLVPSLQETLSVTALEAMACGIPVVGSAVGGIPSVVRSGITGVLVPAQDVIALRTAIGDLLQDPRRREEMSVNCRRVAVEEYRLEIMARRYVELYQSLLSDRASPL